MDPSERSNRHQFTASHIDEDCEGVTGFHENELFFNCTFRKMDGLTLKDCDLNRSKFLIESIRDALNFTVTLNCNSFDHVELSPLIFDLLLMLLMKTTGNDEKRKKLVEVVGRERAGQLLLALKKLE